jgi:hypothetical protein
VGAGVNLNIKALDLVKTVPGDPFFIGIPIDFGFDMIKPGKGGSRFFFRVTPEIHEKGTPIPIGFIWQIYNWKIAGK